MLPLTFRVFDDGETLTSLGYDIVIRRRKVGVLKLASGGLVACDPIHFLETEPFSVSLSPGDYPVWALLAELRDETRLAYAVLRVRSTDPVRWERAVVRGERDDPLSSDQGYRVESSVACMMGARAASMLLDYAYVVMPDEDEFQRTLHAKINQRRHHGIPWAQIDLGRDVGLGGGRGGNILCFEVDPGFYSTWIGYDEGDVAAAIVTDFGVLDLRFYSPVWARGVGHGK